MSEAVATIKKVKATKGIVEMINEGIPVSMAVFKTTVRSRVDGTPQYAFYADDLNVIKPRRANMWLTPLGLLVEQEGQYKMVPSANLTDVNLK